MKNTSRKKTKRIGLLSAPSKRSGLIWKDLMEVKMSLDNAARCWQSSLTFIKRERRKIKAGRSLCRKLSKFSSK